MEGQPASTWVVVQTTEQEPEVPAGASVVVVEELLRAVPVSTYDEVYGQFRRARGPELGEVPLYDVLWQRFAVPFNGFPDHPTGLAHQVVLYQELATHPEAETVEVIESHGLDPEYRALLSDFARNNGIEARFAVSSRRHLVTGLLRGLWSLLLVILDGLISMVTRYWFDFERREPLIFVPHLNRFDAMRPVIEATSENYHIIAPVSTIEWFYHRVRGDWQGPAEFSPIPVGVYVTTDVIRHEFILLCRLIRSELFQGRITDGLTELVDQEFGFRLDHAVRYALGNAYPTNIGPLPNLWLSEHLYETTEGDSVVVGSLSLRQQLFLVAADRIGVASYHVPHTIPTHYDTVPKTDTVHFVPSDADQAYHESADFLWEGSQRVVPIGRPLLARLASERPPAQPIREPIQALIATQPFEDRIRRAFVTQVIEALDAAPIEYQIVIKPHPRENPEFYRDFEIQSDNVCIEANDIHSHIEQSDVTFVVNTNVGLESVALGTPIISINQWEPFTNSRPYQEQKSFPLLRTPTELEDYISELDCSSLEELRERQVQSFDERYFKGVDVAGRIADYIAGERGRNTNSKP